MVHAALLLLMLEAVSTDLVFTISLKRSTQNLQLSTSSPADYPIYASDRDQIAASRQPTRWAMCGRLRVGKGFLHGCRIGRFGHVWTAPSWQGFSSRVQDWSVRPCVRPLSAVHVTAGHNALRGSGPGQKDAFPT